LTPIASLSAPVGPDNREKIFSLIHTFTLSYACYLVNHDDQRTRKGSGFGVQGLVAGDSRARS
jgi:hypothetical protein